MAPDPAVRLGAVTWPASRVGKELTSSVEPLLLTDYFHMPIDIVLLVLLTWVLGIRFSSLHFLVAPGRS